MRTIYVDGGSTAYGLVDLEHGGWPSRLKVATMQEIKDITDPTVVVNHALPGRTMPAIMRDIGAGVANYNRYGPVAAVLQVGLNEAKIYPPNTSPIITKKRFGEQLLQFCGLKTDEILPVLVAPQPIRGSIDNSTGTGSILVDEVIGEYAEVMRLAASSTGAAFVDTRALFEGRDDVIAKDGYHPNELGHLLIADAVLASIKGLESGF